MTYAELQAFLASFSNRSDLTADLPVFVSMAEEEFQVLRVRQMVTRATASVDAEYAETPSNFLAERTATIGDDEVEYLTPEALQVRQCGETGQPRFYTIDAGQMRFYPRPDQAYTVALTYYAKPPTFTESQSNWLAEGFPNTYRHGVMLAASLKTRDETAMALYRGLLDRALSDITARFKDKTGRPLRADPMLLQSGRRHLSTIL